MFTKNQVVVAQFDSVPAAIVALGALRRRFPTVTTEILATAVVLGNHQPELNYPDRMRNFLATL